MTDDPEAEDLDPLTAEFIGFIAKALSKFGTAEHRLLMQWLAEVEEECGITLDPTSVSAMKDAVLYKFVTWRYPAQEAQQTPRGEVMRSTFRSESLDVYGQTVSGTDATFLHPDEQVEEIEEDEISD